MAALRRLGAAGSHQIEIKKSRFICTVSRVETDDDARQVIAALKKERWQANHNCSAYIIGERGDVQRSSDDGEPSGTAGLPMLEVLRKLQLTDTIAVVTRYFGGTLLGAGGLIRAYGGVVGETIRLLGVVERRILTIVAVDADHTSAGRFHNVLASSGFPEATVTYDTDGVRFVVHLEKNILEPFVAWVAEMTNGSLHPQMLGETAIDVPANLDLSKDS